jgi:hypothetical protein
MSLISQSAHVLFSGDVIATSNWTYSDWYRARADAIILQTCVATYSAKDSQNVIFRLEGRFDNLNRAASVYIRRKNTVETVDHVYSIPERFKELRLGVCLGTAVASGLASPCNVYAGICLSEYR